MRKEEERLTVIDLIDRLSPEDRRLQRRNLKAWWQSLTHDEKVAHMSELAEMVRKKMVESGGVMTHEQAIRDFLNKNFPRIQEEAARDMEQAGYVAIARSLRQTRWGVDKFGLEVRLVDDESRDGQVTGG